MSAPLAHLLLIGLLSLSAQPALSAGSSLTPAVDLRAEARQAAQHGGPLIVLYSRKDCKYCETIRRDYLKPLATNPRYRDKIVLRQINQDNEAALTDFRGQPSTQANFASREKIKLVPVVAFYGPDGKRLAGPIVGARLPDFYQSYLEEATDQSIRMLSGR